MEYIHCLVIKDRKLNRLFVEKNVLIDESLIRLNHGAAFFPTNTSKLIAMHKTHAQGDIYYIYWVFSEQAIFRTYVDYKSYYVDYTKSKLRRAMSRLIEEGHTIVIAQYADYIANIPIHISSRSPIVGALGHYHSDRFNAWLTAELPRVAHTDDALSDEDFDTGV